MPAKNSIARIESKLDAQTAGLRRFRAAIVFAVLVWFIITVVELLLVIRNFG